MVASRLTTITNLNGSIIWRIYFYLSTKRPHSRSYLAAHLRTAALNYFYDFSLKHLNQLDYVFIGKNGILLPKLFCPTVRKNGSSDREKLWKFEAAGQDFAKFLRSRTIHSNSEKSEDRMFF